MNFSLCIYLFIYTQIKKERDKEIELVIERLEEDASTTREENERTTEQKIRFLEICFIFTVKLCVPVNN